MELSSVLFGQAAIEYLHRLQASNVPAESDVDFEQISGIIATHPLKGSQNVSVGDCRQLWSHHFTPSMLLSEVEERVLDDVRGYIEAGREKLQELPASHQAHSSSIYGHLKEIVQRPAKEPSLEENGALDSEPPKAGEVPDSEIIEESISGVNAERNSDEQNTEHSTRDDGEVSDTKLEQLEKSSKSPEPSDEKVNDESNEEPEYEKDVQGSDTEKPPSEADVSAFQETETGSAQEEPSTRRGDRRRRSAVRQNPPRIASSRNKKEESSQEARSDNVDKRREGSHASGQPQVETDKEQTGSSQRRTRKRRLSYIEDATVKESSKEPTRQADGFREGSEDLTAEESSPAPRRQPNKRVIAKATSRRTRAEKDKSSDLDSSEVRESVAGDEKEENRADSENPEGDADEKDLDKDAASNSGSHKNEQLKGQDSQYEEEKEEEENVSGQDQKQEIKEEGKEKLTPSKKSQESDTEDQHPRKRRAARPLPAQNLQARQQEFQLRAQDLLDHLSSLGIDLPSAEGIAYDPVTFEDITREVGNGGISSVAHFSLVIYRMLADAVMATPSAKLSESSLKKLIEEADQQLATLKAAQESNEPLPKRRRSTRL